MPHMLVISIENANPYYDDSYVIDSANVGPYGSAITEELKALISPAAPNNPGA